MSNVLLIADVHLSDHPPASCTESYLDDLLDLLEQTVQVAEQYNAITVWAGDVFHLKQPSRNSHGLVRRTIEITQSYPRQLYIVPGNHDLSFDRLDSVPTQPIGTLFKAGAKLLRGWADDIPVYGVPWLQRFTETTVEEALREWRQKVPETGLVVTHAPLYPPGHELKYEFFPAQSWARHMDNQGSCFYGHVHSPHGVWTSEGVTFCNNGALSRGSLDEYNMDRPVVATLWSSLNGEFRTVTLNSKPSKEVFRTEAKVKKEVQVKLDDFLAAIGHATIEITSTSSVIDYVRTLNLGSDLERVVLDLLEDAAVR